MMKRAGNLYGRITTYENLCLAFWKASRGKNNRREVIAFRNDFDINIRKLRDELLKHEPDIGHYRFFDVCDPKPRSICAASFPERVLHHAIMNICEPILESYSIYDSYACRKGKGNRKALARAKGYARKYDWYLKLDIRKYFDSIDHGIMMKQLSRQFKDKPLLLLFEKMLRTYHTSPGKGMPIGNLISQHLANFHLGCLDHRMKEERGISAYIRYMDDILIFGNDKDRLKEELRYITDFMANHLDLEPNRNIQLNRCSRGIPFLGYRVFGSKILLLPRSRWRFVNKFRTYEKKWSEGKWSENRLIRRMGSLIEFTKLANAAGLRHNVIRRFGVSS